MRVSEGGGCRSEGEDVGVRDGRGRDTGRGEIHGGWKGIK